MVIAIVIIILGAFFFHSQNASIKKAEIRDPVKMPIQNFIEACITQTAQDAIRTLGLNGGYITFPEEIEKNPRSYLQFGPLDNIKNPYWWYDGIENVPSENFIVSQIENHIIKNLNSCINGLSDFGSQFEIKKQGNLNVEATLNENDVTIGINYPLELTTKFNQTTIKFEKFRQILPTRLKTIYETAKDIMEAENRDLFLELKTIDLITLDESIPTTDIEVTCDEKVWIQDDIERKLKRLLNVNLPFINIVGSDFNNEVFVPNPFGEDTYKESYFENHYKWKITEKNYRGLKVSFDYDERWPLQLYARPSSKGLLKSNTQKGQDVLKFFCMHIWHFTYDTIFPVKVTVTESNPNYDDYQFSFAFMVSVDHNQPKREYFGKTLLEPIDLGSQEEYCKDLVNEQTIYTITNSTEESDLAKVNLTYTCGRFTCNLGKSEWLGFGAAAGLSTRFPYCVNGILRGEKEGYQDTMIFIQTETPGTHFMYLKPIKEFSRYTVVKHDFDNPAAEMRLGKNEKAAITIKSKNSDFETYGVYPAEGDFPITILNNDEEYEITIYLSDGKELIGGYKATWKANSYEITDANQIKFHVLEKKGSDDEKALFLSGLESYSSKVSQPELI